MAINVKDPRLQRAQLAAYGRPSQNAAGVVAAETEKFAANQQDFLNQMGALGNQRREFDLQMALNQKKLAWSRQAFNQQRKDVRDSMRMGLIGGLFNLGVAGAIGWDRRRQSEALAEQTAAHQKRMADLQAAQNATLAGILGKSGI